MDINLDDLEKYDTEHAKKGDKLICGYRSYYGSHWTFGTYTIKSVSAKRGDITLDDRAGTRFDKYGCRLGRARYDTSSDILLECSEGNVTEINKYTEHNNLVRKTCEALEKLTKRRGELLDMMPTEKIEQLYEIVKDFAKEK